MLKQYQRVKFHYAWKHGLIHIFLCMQSDLCIIRRQLTDGCKLIECHYKIWYKRENCDCYGRIWTVPLEIKQPTPLIQFNPNIKQKSVLKMELSDTKLETQMVAVYLTNFWTRVLKSSLAAPLNNWGTWFLKTLQSVKT